MEEFRNIPNHEGYQVSNLGRVKSFKSTEKILKNVPSNRGYLRVNLQPPKNVHTLVAMAFLGYKPNGMLKVIDHINGNKLDNRVDNLQIITQRENVSKDKKGYSSKYIGVSKHRNKWLSTIRIKGKKVSLGTFDIEEDAAMSYSLKLSEIKSNRNYEN